MYGNIVRAVWLGISTALTAITGSAAYAQDGTQPDLMFVFDASGSMWGQVNGVAKIEIARNVFTDMSQSWAESQQAVGLIAYGHRRRGDCSDIELLQSPSEDAAQSVVTQVQNLTPRGKTPLSQAVRMAAQELKFTEKAATVVLLSDGKETCDLDPCAIGAELERLGVSFTAHVIGFDIQNVEDKAQLQCLAENTGGSYVDARDAATLTTALTEVTGQDVVTAPADTDTGTTEVNLNIAVADGTARPATVRLSAADAGTGETLDLGVLEGADQVISGVTLDLPQGDWTFTAAGDGGAGEIAVSLTESQQDIFIPFEASNAAFDFLGADTFATDGTIAFQLRSREPLQQNATYSVMLFRQGASAFEENITFTYRFGTDPETTEHAFYPWEFDLPVGAYEVVIMGDSYDLGENLGRFPVQLVATLEDSASEANATQTEEQTAAPSFAFSQIAEPLRPGVADAFMLEGPVEAGDQVMFIGLDGQDTQMLAVSQSGLVAVPSQIAEGAFRVHLVRQDGSDVHLGLVDILPASAQDTGDHSTGGEPSDTMIGRSWTIDDFDSGNRVGLIKIDEPTERAETVSVSLRLDNPGQFGLSEDGIVQTQLRLIWDHNQILVGIQGEIAMGNGTPLLMLSRPGGWDGTSEAWVGIFSNPANGRAVRLKLY